MAVVGVGAEACPYACGDAERAVERHGAVVARANRDSVFGKRSCQIVRVNERRAKRDD